MRTFILLTIVALAVASPIEDKKTPDISNLPLKKDDSKNATSKVIDSYTQDGIHATPLHKRDTQQVASPTLNNDPARSGLPKTGQQPSTSSPQNKNQQPLINNQRQNSASLNNQRQTSSSLNNQKQSTQSATNQQKTPLVQTDPIPPRTLSQSNVQPNLASSSRVRRDAPRPTDQKTSSLNTQQTSTQQKTPQVPAQKSPQSTQQKTPAAAPAKGQAPLQGSRVTRDAPKPVDTKAAPQPTSTSGQKSSINTATASKPVVPTAKAPAFDTKAPAVPPTNSRKTRDAPNPHEQSKIVPSSTNTGVHLNKDTAPLNPSVAAKSPATSAPLHKRESPVSNVRGDSQLPSSSSNNQSPQFVHPVPVDHILKKQPDSNPSSTLTKTDSVKITPSLPTTETKTSDVTKVDAKH